MSDDGQEPETPLRTPWYADPSVKAVCSIAGVGVSLAALLLAVGLWVLSSLQPGSEDEPAAGSETVDAQTEPARLVESDPVVETRGDEVEVPTESDEEGASADPVEPEVVADPQNAARDEVQPDTADPIVGDTEVRLSPDTDFSRVIQGRTVSLMESLQARRPVYIVAERVVLSEDAVLSGPHVWILADEVSGGALDVSGVDGTTDDRDGSDAGSIYVLATRIERLSIRAVGGNGAEGGQGPRGRNGRNGSCAGFGGWRPAQRGGNGGVGERGGRGGDGGGVRVVFGDSYEPRNVNRNPGSVGAGGPGGPPGGGGDGCVGLGGTQPAAAGGSPGRLRDLPGRVDLMDLPGIWPLKKSLNLSPTSSIGSGTGR